MAMVFLPDGKLAVAGGRPGQEGDVRIYDIDAGKPKDADGVAILDGVNDKAVLVKRAARQPTTRCCAWPSAPTARSWPPAAATALVRVWDLSGGYADAKLEQTIENHADWVLGRRLLARRQAPADRAAATRPPRSGTWQTKESVLTFPDHQNTVYGVGGQGRRQGGYSVGEDKQLRAWNAPARASRFEPRAATAMKSSRCCYTNGKTPLLADVQRRQHGAPWSARMARRRRRLSGHTDWVYAVAVSPDGTLVASGSMERRGESVETRRRQQRGDVQRLAGVEAGGRYAECRREEVISVYRRQTLPAGLRLGT